HAFVGPGVLGVGRIERGVGGEPDGGVAAAEGGEGVVEVILAFEIGNVGGPGAARAGDFLLAPLRDAGERRAGVGPVDEVLGSADGDGAAGSAAPTAGAEDVVRVLLFDDDGIVHAFHVAGELQHFGVGGRGSSRSDQPGGRGGEDCERYGGAVHRFPKL